MFRSIGNFNCHLFWSVLSATGDDRSAQLEREVAQMCTAQYVSPCPSATPLCGANVHPVSAQSYPSSPPPPPLVWCQPVPKSARRRKEDSFWDGWWALEVELMANALLPNSMAGRSGNRDFMTWVKKKRKDMISKLATISTLALVFLARVDGSKKERFLGGSFPQTLVTLVITAAHVGGRQERYPAVNAQTIGRPNYGRPASFGRPGRPGEDCDLKVTLQVYFPYVRWPRRRGRRW